MLDVHVPHKPLQGVREFLFHLFTITVGLLIATQIESFVEWRHHVHLAVEARASLRKEIERNLNDLKKAQPDMGKWRTAIDSDLAGMNRILEHPSDPAVQHTSLTVNYSSITLSDTAWKTAQSTGALAYMPYDEAERYASIYQAQESLLKLQEKPLEDVAGIYGLLAKFHWRERSKITPEQAGAMAERLGQLRLHLVTADVFLQGSIETSSAFLENRKAKQDFRADLK